MPDDSVAVSATPTRSSAYF